MKTSLETRLVAALSGRGATLATAESCTGGLIGHRITSISGASACYAGGVIAYSNAVKVSLLGVAGGTLAAHGAVSEPVAAEMARGALRAFGATYALAVTGIAGPTGGTPEKPVGLVYISAARAGETRVTRNLFNGSRAEIKEQTADAAMNLLWEWLDAC